MKNTKKLLFTLLLVALAAALLAVGFTSSAATVVEQGYCGVGVQDPVTLEYDNSAAQWTLDSEGTMTITGTGAIANLWDDSLKESIRKLVIQNGITEIKFGSFKDCTNLATVTIANSVYKIGQQAFQNTAWLAAQRDGVIYAGKVAIGYQGAFSEVGYVSLIRDCTGIAGEAFYRCAALKEISIPSSVAYIGYKAFAQTGIEKISIPCLTDAEVFEDCANLTDVTIRDGVQIINSFSFFNCSLKSISIPESVTLVGPWAFSGCRNLANVFYVGSEAQWNEIAIDPESDANAPLLNANIYYNVVDWGYCGRGGPDDDPTSIAWVYDADGTLTLFGEGSPADTYMPHIDVRWADYLPTIQNVVIEEGVTTLPDSAFHDCENLKSVTIPDTVTEIGYDAFCGCRSLTSVRIPEGVTRIETQTFVACQSLKTITIPASVITIKDAFYDCSALTDVYYGGSEAQWGEIAFDQYGNDPLQSANIHFNVVDWGYCGGEGDGTNLIWVLDTDGTLTVSGSGYARNGAFQGHTDVKNVVFLDGTDYIGGNMFAGCGNLESITIPHSSMEEIEVTAFADCDSLSVIYYDGTPAQWDLMTIYYHAENLGGSYTEYAQTMRAYLKSLVQFADTDWGYCGGEGDGTNLMWELSTDYTLTISGTGEMANYTLYDHRTSAPWGPYYIRLKTVVLQPGVTSIGDAAFNGCIALKNVTIPAGVLSIGDAAFSSCYMLESITIPDGVTSIPPSAFATCLALTSVMIPDSVTSIDAGAFSYCTALQDVYYGGSEAQWGEIQIDESGEYGNESLLNANIHYNVAAWGHYGEPVYILYKDGKLVLTGEGSTPMASPFPRTVNSVEIENGVTHLAASAFGHQSTLTTAKLGSGLTGLEPLTFSDCTGLTSVTIPASITTIGERAFNGCTALTDIFYGGSEAQWNAMTIGAGNDPLLNAHIHYNATGHTPGEAVIENNVPATCAEAGGYDEVVYCTQCPCECSRTHVTVDPINHKNAQTLTATEATATEHGHTAGVWCPDCETWLSGGDVIHNHLGAQTVIKPATATEDGLVDIVCTVCGEHGQYTVSATGPQPDDHSGDSGSSGGFWQQITGFFKGFIDWFLRLFKWFGK